MSSLRVTPVSTRCLSTPEPFSLKSANIFIPSSGTYCVSVGCGVGVVVLRSVRNVFMFFSLLRAE